MLINYPQDTLPVGYGEVVGTYEDGMTAILGDNGYLFMACEGEDGFDILACYTKWTGTAREVADKWMKVGA